jgi:hypothetical protein
MVDARPVHAPGDATRAKVDEILRCLAAAVFVGSIPHQGTQ